MRARADRPVQSSSPHRRLNTVEGWSRDVTVDIADELRRRRYAEFGEVPDSVLAFMEADRR